MYKSIILGGSITVVERDIGLGSSSGAGAVSGPRVVRVRVTILGVMMTTRPMTTLLAGPSALLQTRVGSDSLGFQEGSLDNFTHPKANALECVVLPTSGCLYFGSFFHEPAKQ